MHLREDVSAAAQLEERMVRELADRVELDRLGPFEAVAEKLNSRLADDVAELQLTRVAALALAWMVEGHITGMLQPALSGDGEATCVHVERDGGQDLVGDGFGVARKSH